MHINKGRPPLKILKLLAAASILSFLVESKNSKMDRLSKRTAAALNTTPLQIALFDTFSNISPTSKR